MVGIVSELGGGQPWAPVAAPCVISKGKPNKDLCSRWSRGSWPFKQHVFRRGFTTNLWFCAYVQAVSFKQGQSKTYFQRNQGLCLGERTDWQMGKLLVGVTYAQIFCSRKAPQRVISLGHFGCVPGSWEGDTEGAGLGWVEESSHCIRGAHLQFLHVCLPQTSRFDLSACRALLENIVLL